MPGGRGPGGDALGRWRAWAATRSRINPLVPADLVIDHSVQVDFFGIASAPSAAMSRGVRAQPRALCSSCAGRRRRSDNFRVVPPGTGIVHQVNLEYLATVVHSDQRRRDGRASRHAGRHRLAHHDDQRAGRARLGRRRHRGRGRACSASRSTCCMPEVVGFRLTGELPEGATATDLVLTITQMLRKHGVVGKFVEFFGEGLAAAAGRPRHDRQHGARVRRHRRLLPGRRRDAALPARDRPRPSAGRSGRALQQGAGPVPHRRDARAAVHRDAGAGPGHGGAEPGRAARPQDRVALGRGARESSAKR